MLKSGQLVKEVRSITQTLGGTAYEPLSCWNRMWLAFATSIRGKPAWTSMQPDLLTEQLQVFILISIVPKMESGLFNLFNLAEKGLKIEMLIFRDSGHFCIVIISQTLFYCLWPWTNLSNNINMQRQEKVNDSSFIVLKVPFEKFIQTISAKRNLAISS